MAELRLVDAKPREAFIALCLIVPIIGIGIYPKLATQTYDVKTVEVAQQARQALSLVAQPLVAQQPLQLQPVRVAPLLLGTDSADLTRVLQ